MTSPQRNLVEAHPVDLEALLGPVHPARLVWAFVLAMDMAPLAARNQSVGWRELHG